MCSTDDSFKSVFLYSTPSQTPIFIKRNRLHKGITWCFISETFVFNITYILHLHVKRRPTKTRQPVLTSLYCSVYISESDSRVADASVNIFYAG